MEGIEALLGADPADLSWQDMATCKPLAITDSSDDIFYDLYERKDEKARTADDMCIGCPVAVQCLNYAQVEKLEGCWGGVYLNAQGKPDPAKNRHKTEEVWDLLEQIHNTEFTEVR